MRNPTSLFIAPNAAQKWGICLLELHMMSKKIPTRWMILLQYFLHISNHTFLQKFSHLNPKNLAKTAHLFNYNCRSLNLHNSIHEKQKWNRLTLSMPIIQTICYKLNSKQYNLIHHQRNKKLDKETQSSL